MEIIVYVVLCFYGIGILWPAAAAHSSCRVEKSEFLQVLIVCFYYNIYDTCTSILHYIMATTI